jgi:Glycosyltransferase family 87
VLSLDSVYGKSVRSSVQSGGTFRHVVRRVRGWYDRHSSGRAVVVSWLVTRLLMVAILAFAERFIVGDVFYYHRKIAALFSVGLGKTLNEYPTPVVWILSLPYGMGAGSRVGYLIAFVLLMLALDAAFSWALWRTAGRRRNAAVDFWLIFVFLVGPLCYVRFDILPAVLAGGALLAARRRPWVTGALTGLGAAVKLWPALLFPFFLAHRPDRKAVTWGFVGVGFGLAFVSLVFGGWIRLISPLTWQSGRGLQIESIWATPLMMARAVRPGEWIVDYSKFQAYEIFGAGVSPLLVLSNLATVAGLIVILALYVRAFRNQGPTPVAIGLAVLATVAIMTITNKTLSPQYLLWLGGPMAALLFLRSGATERERAALRRLAIQLLLLAVLTQLVYPLLYDGLLGRLGQPMIIVSTLVTTLRNLALLAFTVEVCRLAWRTLAATGDRVPHQASV